MEVRIVRGGPWRLAYAHALGASPEEEAIERLVAWAGPRGLLEGLRDRHLFGANDPPPSGPGDEYGYYFGVTVGGDVEPGEGVSVRDLLEATYAVTRVRGVEGITDAWRGLYDWVGASAYRVAGHGLEELLSPLDGPVEGWTFDLWLPVEEG